MIHTILVVEDDDNLRSYLRDLLLDNRYTVYSEADGAKALKFIEKKQPNLVVLDLGLPTISGETVCADIKKNYPQIPVIILTAKDNVSDIVSGLNLGADDYITKPFESEELLARIKARLRTFGEEASVIKVGDLELDNKTLEVKREGKIIKLTPQEFKVLNYLMANKGSVLTREMILSRIWMSEADIETRVVDVYIGYLRKKIDNGFDKKLIYSIRGWGYMIKE